MARGVTCLDALVPCTRDEVILVLREHERYLRAFARRRENIYAAAVSIDEAIREAAYRRTHGIGEAPRQGRAGDPVYSAYSYAEDMTKKQRTFLVRRLKMLGAEERKFACIMEAFESLPPSSREFLLDKFQHGLTNEELHERHIGKLSGEESGTAVRRRVEKRYNHLIGLIMEKCTYTPPERTGKTGH